MTRISFPIVFSLICILSVSSRLYALDAEEIINKKEYSTYMDQIVKKYSSEKGKKEKLVRELNGLISEFGTLKNRLKMKDSFKMKIATLAPDGTAWIAPAADLLIPLLTEVSQGLLRFTLYTGGVMGEDKDILRKMKMGQLHGCGCTAQGLVTAAPELSVLSLPFLFKDYKEIDYVLGKFRDEIDTILERKGIALFALIDTGYFYLFVKEKADTLENFRKQKFLTWFGETERDFLKNLGITPIPLPVSEVVMSLRSGIINADIAPAAWFLATQAYESTEYFVEPPFFYSIAAIVLDKGALAREGERYGLTKKDTEEILRLATKLVKVIKLEEVWNDMLRNFEKDCLKAFTEHGLKPLPMNGKELTIVQDAGRKVWDDLSDKEYPKELKEKIVSAISDYRKRNNTALK